MSQQEQEPDKIGPAESKDRTPSRLAWAVTCGFLTALYLLFIVDLPTTSHDILLILITTLANQWGAIMNYYFGSSTGSAKKTDAIVAQAVKNDKPLTPP